MTNGDNWIAGFEKSQGLENALNDVEAIDVSRVFDNLFSGFYNQLNAFIRRMKAGGRE